MNKIKPEFTRPFNAEHAQAGAPYCCRDGDEVTVLHWNGRHPVWVLSGISGQLDMPAEWNINGEFQHKCRDSPRDLVMLPLGMCQGKPVFVGDILIERNRSFKAGPNASFFMYCTWPEFEIEYPTTKLTDGDLRKISEKHYSVEDSLRAIADAAIRHAIDTGQVVFEKIKELHL